MRKAFYTATLIASSFANAATPIDGLYATLSGGYTYLPNNLSLTKQGIIRNDAKYNAGFDAGGSIGYKSNPLRYEGELTYINANLDKFNANRITQTGVTGSNNAILAMANVFYDLPQLVDPIQPYVGVGIGYAWINGKFASTGPNLATTYHNDSNSAFAYQAAGGFIFNFAENYAAGVGYRYVATERVSALGKVFQAHMANLTVIYRCDGNKYK